MLRAARKIALLPATGSHGGTCCAAPPVDGVLATSSVGSGAKGSLPSIDDKENTLVTEDEARFLPAGQPELHLHSPRSATEHNGKAVGYPGVSERTQTLVGRR